MRIATFNLENLDDETGQDPSLATRVAIMRPQLERIAADILCLQEVHSRDSPQGRTLAALDTLLAGTGTNPVSGSRPRPPAASCTRSATS